MQSNKFLLSFMLLPASVPGRAQNNATCEPGSNVQSTAGEALQSALAKLKGISPGADVDVKGIQLQNALIENRKAYILVNARNEKDYVWDYDPAAGVAKPGLEIVGGYGYMLRPDRIK